MFRALAFVVLSTLTLPCPGLAEDNLAKAATLPVPEDLSSFKFLVGKWKCPGEETYRNKKHTSKSKNQTLFIGEFVPDVNWIQLRFLVVESDTPSDSFHEHSFININPATKKPVIVSIDDGHQWDVEESAGWIGSEISFKTTHSARKETSWTKIKKTSDDEFELNCGSDIDTKDIHQSCKKICKRNNQAD